MNPSKSIMDYMTEINRLFPRSPGDDFFQTTNTSHSPISLLTPANRSSSSADSTSPDSFPDLFQHRLTSEYRHDQQMFETPLAVRRQRPIVGRKIMQKEPTFNQATIPEIDLAIWQPDEQQTPPGAGKVFIENKNYTQDVVYELFPAENRAREFKMPAKTPSNSSPISNYTPNRAMVSPSTSNMPMSNVSPTSNSSLTRYPSRFPSPALSVVSSGPSTSSFSRDVGPSRMCTFCRKNGETPLVYMTHMVKERVGQRQIVTCPILRSHVCSTCGASGDNAHTITYCPILRHSNNGLPLQSTTITLKNTRVKSNGRRRY